MISKQKYGLLKLKIHFGKLKSKLYIIFMKWVLEPAFICIIHKKYINNSLINYKNKKSVQEIFDFR